MAIHGHSWLWHTKRVPNRSQILGIIDGELDHLDKFLAASDGIAGANMPAAEAKIDIRRPQDPSARILQIIDDTLELMDQLERAATAEIPAD